MSGHRPDVPGAYQFGQGSRITTATRLDAQAAWRAVTSWPEHARGVPLTHLSVTHPPGRDTPGAGDVLNAVSGVGPLRIVDTMVVSRWEPPTPGQPGIAVLVKTGSVVVGGASVQVDSARVDDAQGDRGAAGSIVTWWEDARPGNPILQRLARPVNDAVTTFVFGRAVRRLLSAAEDARR